MSRPWVLVSGDFTPRGGQDMANLALARTLAARGRPVHLVAHAVSDDVAGLPGVVVHRAPRPLGRHLLGGLLLDRLGRRTARALRGARVVVNGGNCIWPDVCWVHCVHSAYDLPSRPETRPRRLRARLVQERNRHRERRVFRAARLVVANSERTRRDLLALGVAEHRVALVPLGVDPVRFGPASPEERRAGRARFGLDPERPMVLFVGALGALDMKGPDTLIRAWSRLCADPAWRAELVVVGGGRVEDWRARTDALGLGGRVRFLGRVDAIEVVQAACDVLVHPTRYDSYGLAVHEALCRGRPVVVSRAAGVSARLTGPLTRLILDDPDDDAELSRLLRAALNDLPDHRSAAAELGEALRRWTWDDMADQFIAEVDARG